MGRHRREIPVVVQQCVVELDAVSADDDVDGLADGNARFPQSPIVASGFDRQVFRQQWDDPETPQGYFQLYGVRLVSRSLQDFKQDKVAQKKRFPAGRRLQRCGRRRAMAAKMGDPDRTIDEDHDPVG